MTASDMAVPWDHVPMLSSTYLQELSSLELERRKSKLQVLPLLASRKTYMADLFDLTNTSSARNHWIDLLKSGLDKVSMPA